MLPKLNTWRPKVGLGIEWHSHMLAAVGIDAFHKRPCCELGIGCMFVAAYS